MTKEQYIEQIESVLNHFMKILNEVTCMQAIDTARINSIVELLQEDDQTKFYRNLNKYLENAPKEVKEFIKEKGLKF